MKRIPLTIKEISHVTAEDGKHSIVAVLPDEIHKVFSHRTHEFMFGHLEQLRNKQEKHLVNIYAVIRMNNIFSVFGYTTAFSNNSSFPCPWAVDDCQRLLAGHVIKGPSMLSVG